MSTRALIGLTAFSIFVAVAGAFILSSAAPDGKSWPLQGGRFDDLNATFTTMRDEGAPPLVARVDPNAPIPLSSAGSRQADFRLVGQGDDEGLYVAAPQVAVWLGLDDVREGIKFLYVALFAVALLSYPVIFWKLTGSLKAAVAAPLTLIISLVALHGLVIDSYSDVPGDAYWILGWITVALLPPLLMLARMPRWRAGSFALLFAMMLVAAAASVIRLNAGLPIALAALAVVVFSRRDWHWPSRVAAALAVAAVYLLIIPAGMAAIRDHGQSWAEARGSFFAQVTTQHPFWHSAFIGSGYLPNSGNVLYRDDVAYTRAVEVDPDVQYLSPHYDDILQDLFVDEVKARPIGMLWQDIRKVVVVLRVAAFELFLAALLLLAAFMVGRDRNLLGWGLVVAGPSLLLGMGTAIVVIPDAQYVLGFTGALLFLLVLAVAALAATMSTGVTREGAAAALRRARERLRTEPKERRAAVAAAAVVFLALVGTAAGASIYKSSRDWLTNSTGVADLTDRKAFAKGADGISSKGYVDPGVPGPRPALPKATHFDGLSAYALADYDPFASDRPVTVEGWARRDNDDSLDTLFGSSAAATPALLRIVPDTHDVGFFPANGLTVTWPDAWPAGSRWVHWAITVTAPENGGAKAQLYIDGKPQGEMDVPPFSDDYGKFVVGAWSFNYRDPFAGDLAGIAVFDRALTADEIAQHSSAGHDYAGAVGASDPQLFWKLGAADGIEVPDSSGYDRRGVLAWEPNALAYGG